MKTSRQFALAAATSLFVVSFTLTAQMHHHDSKAPKGEQRTADLDTSMSGQRTNDMTQKMGKATFEESVNGLHVRVWLITQVEHKRLMSTMMKDSSEGGKMNDDMKEGEMKHDMGGMMKEGMKHEEMGNKQMMESMMSGTHHIMTVLTGDKTGEPVKNAVIQLTTLFPSKKLVTSRLGAMKDHFGGSLDLGETGQYELSLTIKVGAGTSYARFFYGVE